MKNPILDLLTVYSQTCESETVSQEKVTYDGKDYWVSTANTPDHGWETMVFAMDTEGNVNWTDLYTAHYLDREGAEKGHAAVVSGFSTLPLRTDGGSSYYDADDFDDDDFLN